MVDGLQQRQGLNEFLTAIEAIENDFAMHTRRNGTGGGGGNGTDDAGGNSTNGTSGEGGGNGTSGGAGGNESAVADGAGGNESASNATGNSTDSNALPPGTTALTLRISMPYTLAEFDEEKQTAFKQAVAAAAGVDVGAVWINATEQSARRRLLEDGIVVETRIYGGSAAVITQTLGTGDELLAKLNAELTRLGLRASSGVILSNDSCVPVSGLVFCAHLNDLNGSAHYDDATGEHSDDSLLRLDAALERMFMMHHSVASNASCKRAFQSLLCPDMLGVCASAGGFMRACADACMAVEECLHPEWSHQTRKVVCATLGYTQNGPACVASVPAAPIAVRAPAAPVQPSQIVTFVAILPLSKVDFASREYLYTKSVAAVAQVAVSRVIVEKVDEVMTSKWRSLHLAGVSVNAGAGSQAGMASSGFDGSGLQLNEHRGHARNTGAAGVSVASYHAQGRTRTWARRSELSVTVQTQVCRVSRIGVTCSPPSDNC